MNIKLFLQQDIFKDIDERLQEIKNEIALNSFNLFTLSSYNSYLENFHSDIIAMLLNPSERHNQSNFFLNSFLEFLISLNIKVNKNDYKISEVTREKGNIDIWIKDSFSKKSIIIENKINDATDQKNQLKKYYEYAKKSGFNVDAIIYLTLNGNKNAPITDIPELNSKVVNISAFTNSSDDLVNGWLAKSYDNLQEEDSRSFIFQYSKLIKHLSQIGMDKQIKDDFYSVIKDGDGFQKVKAITELTNGLEEYRADLFMSKINNDYQPFRKTYRWRPHHWLFERFNDNNVVFKLDVYFNSDGSARIDFWNPHQPEEIQKLSTSTKLKSIGLFKEFEFGGFGGGMFKSFTIDEYKNIENLDNELYRFVKLLFKKLRK